MKKLLALCCVLLLTACSSEPVWKDRGAYTPLSVREHKVLANESAPDGKPLVFAKAPEAYSDLLSYYNVMTDFLVDNGAKVEEVMKLYRELIGIEPKESYNRKKALAYLTDTNIYLIEAGRGEEALVLAKALDALIPMDFYVQNRSIGAYRVMAEQKFQKKDFAGALVLIQKARAVRFDTQATSLWMKIEMELAKQDIRTKKFNEAKAKLDEVVQIATMEDNKLLFPDELAAAKKLLSGFRPAP